MDRSVSNRHHTGVLCHSLERWYVLSVGLILLCLAPTNVDAQHPTVRNKADVDRWIEKVSNWGRWGADDQLGTLNLITPQKRIDALKLVKDGVSISLAHPLLTEPAADNGNPFQHKMLAVGRGADGPWAMDHYGISYHGLAHSHMDSLCHLFYDGRMYNGFSRDEVGPEGAEKLHIANVRGGIMTRGVLIDLPELRGVRFLEPGSPILPGELESWEQKTGLKILPGDVVLIRTGRWARRATMGPWNPSQDGMAGLHASCVQWIRDRDPAVMGSDAALDVIPSRVEGVTHPIHVFVLHAMGIHIFDNCDLEALSEHCRKHNRWEFLITAAPLVVEGGTGSPLNPIATF